MSPLRPALTLTALLLAVACSKAKSGAPATRTSAANASASASATPPLTLGRKQLDTPTAFELTPSNDGATLVWAPAAAKDGALFGVDLDGAGRPKATARSLIPTSAVHGDISDLAVAWVKHELALAWVERDAAKARVRAAWASGGGRVFELGSAWVAPRTARGNLVIAARGDAALIFARGDEAACIEPGRRGCFGFSFHELHGDRVEATGLPLSVPVPCTDGSTALAVVGSRWHYGVCTDTGKRPVTTMFSIQREPDYARADTLLEGCEPAGMLNYEGAAWLIGDCEGQRRAVRLGREDERAESLDLRGTRLDCAGGAARLRAAGFDLALDEPRGGLHALLPAELAPRGARAVWTGRALLVATTLGEELRVTSHVCRGDKLEAAPLDAAQ